MSKPIRFGLDISDHSVEIIGLSERGGKAIIEWAGRLKLPAGVVRRGVILDQDKLTLILGQLFDSAFGTNRSRHLQVGFALPETQVFSKIFRLPANFTEEQAVQAAKIEATNVFPIRLNDTMTAAVTLPSSDDQHRDHLLAAVSREVAEPYLQVFRNLKAEPLFFESEAIALSRSLDFSGNGPILIVDIGTSVTGMVVHDRGGVRMTSVANIGGDALTVAIETKMNISLEKAEMFKRTNGFLPDKDKGRVFLILQSPMAEIIDEVKRTVIFYGRKTGREISQIQLIGGNSLLPGIVDYVASNFPDTPVALGQPFRGIHLTAAQKSVGDQGVLFSTAIGVAWRASGFRQGTQFDFLQKTNRQSTGIGSLFGLVGKTGLAFKHMVQGKTKSSDKAEDKAKSAKPAKKRATPKKKSVTNPPEEKVVQIADVVATETVLEAAPAGDGKPESIYQFGSMDDIQKDESEGILNDLEAAQPEIVQETVSENDLDSFGSAMSGAGNGVIETEDVGTDRVTVDTILARAKQDEDEDDMAYPVRSGDRGRLIALVILIVVLAVATAGGVYMLMKRHGADLMAGIFDRQDRQEVPVDEPVQEVPKVPENVSVTVRLGTVSQPDSETRPFVLTRVIEVELEKSSVFDSTGQATTTAGLAEGIIKIVNTTDRDYSFVATTRFLTEDGKLYRMKEGATIPAEGSVEVVVAADKSGAEYDIGPSKFTIPGLGSDFEDKVWGESETSMTGGAGFAKAITSADLIKAKADLLEGLEKEAETKLKELAQEDEVILPDLMTSEEVSYESPEEGTVSANFKAVLKNRFRVMVLPQGEIDRKLIAQLVSVLPEGENQADYDIGLPQFTLEAYDTKEGLAEVRIDAAITKSFAAPAEPTNGLPE